MDLLVIAALIGDLKGRPSWLNKAVWIDSDKEKSGADLPAIVTAVQAKLDEANALSTQQPSIGEGENWYSVNGVEKLRSTKASEVSALRMKQDEPSKAVQKAGSSRPLSPANKRLQEALLLPSPYKYNDILHAILAGATDFTLVDTVGRTGLHWAVKCDNFESVQIAISHGADVNAITKKKQTPLSLAPEDCSRRVLNLLKKHGAR